MRFKGWFKFLDYIPAKWRSLAVLERLGLKKSFGFPVNLEHRAPN